MGDEDRVVGEAARLEAGRGEQRVGAVRERFGRAKVLALDEFDAFGNPLKRGRDERHPDAALHGVLDLLPELVP